MDPASYIAGVSFRVLQPSAPRGRDGLFALARGGRPPARVLQLPGAPLDALNTVLPPGESSRAELLHALCGIPRMATVAVGALINLCVETMPHDHSFVNVGVWNGFTFLSAITGNSGKRCVGVDDFSEFGGPRDAFLERFGTVRGEHHEFHDMDYSSYFADIHRGPVGVYLYDGHHSYENQWQGLAVAEPHLADGCVVLVDDTNWDEPRAGTLDFMAQSRLEYQPLLDETTSGNRHPTFWNGLMAFRVRRPVGGPEHGRGEPEPASAAQRPAAREGGSPGRHSAPAPRDGAGEGHPDLGPSPLDSYAGPRRDGAPLVSVIVRNAVGDPVPFRETLASVMAQDWHELEVLAADETGDPHVRETLAGVAGRVVDVPAESSGRSALEAAIARSRGPFVAFTEAGTTLDPTAVHMALAFSRLTQFFQPAPRGERLRWLERVLATGDDLAAAVPPGGAFAWAGGKLRLPDTLRSRRALPLVTENGDGAAAVIERLEVLRADGARHAAFAWPAFGLLGDLPGLEHHLRSEHDCVVENDRLLVFDLS